jgi:prepilin-type N-terminal cleavage/methylation domain-containing protein
MYAMVPPRRHPGFSLIELLVVIAIIGLLAGILYPSLSRATQLGRGVSCANNLKGCGVAIRMYLNENNDIMPVAAAMPSLGLTDEPAIAEVLAPYIDNPELLHCPADTGKGRPGGKSYFETEASSYEYHTLLGGQTVGRDFLTERLGESQSPVLHDYQPFHGRPGKPGAMNYLFVDGTVGDLGN